MLADISGEELESYMISNGIVGEASQAATDVPLNSSCSDAEHAAMVNLKI
jgi:hypothetical protein